MRAVLRRLYEFWFARETPIVLPLLRVALGGMVLLVTMPRDATRLRNEAGAAAAAFEPSALLRALDIPLPLPDAAIYPFYAAMMGLALLTIVGLATRPALFLLAIGTWYIGTQFSASGWYNHSRALPMQVMLVLAVAPGTTAWSADRLLSAVLRRAPRATLLPTLAGPPVPRWGERLVLVLLAALFFSAGASKLRYSGVRWADGQTLGAYLTGVSIRPTPVPAESVAAAGAARRGAPGTRRVNQFAGPPDVPPARAWRDGFGIENYLYRVVPTPLGRFVGERPWLLAVASTMSLLLELAAPVLLLGGRVRNVYLLSAVGFLTGINLTMAISFLPWIVVIVCALDWRSLVADARAMWRLVARRGAGGRPLGRVHAPAG